MHLNFPTSTFTNQSLKDYYDYKDCEFFIFQYEFKNESKGKNDLTLKCYPAKKDLELYGSDNNPLSVSGKEKYETDPVKADKNFGLGNVTVPKEMLSPLFSTIDLNDIIISPNPEADDDPKYVSIQLSIAGLLPLVLNPSPPARRTSTS